VGFLASVVSFARAVVAGEQAPECRVDLDGGDGATALALAPPGLDAVPLPGDLAGLVAGSGRGEALAVGYQDPKSAGQALPGEARLYSRAAAGELAAEVWLKADGTIVARSASGATLELAPDGSARVGSALGELAVDPAGVVTWRTPLGTNGAGTHTHATPFGPSGPPLPGT